MLAPIPARMLMIGDTVLTSDSTALEVIRVHSGRTVFRNIATSEISIQVLHPSEPVSIVTGSLSELF